jgi:c-di-GMP-binding flagellar brake protein YcgR
MENKTEGKNRRKSERIDVAFSLVYSVEKPYALRVSLGLVDETDALMMNLSDLGMAIITKYDIPLSTILYIKFNIIDLRLTGDQRFRHLEINGKVVSNVILPDVSYRTGHRIGVCFINISNEDKMAISDFVKHNMFHS